MALLRKIPLTGAQLNIAFILLLVEFVRGAYLAAFLPIYTVKELALPVTVAGAAVTAHYIADTSIKSYLGYLLDRFSPRLIVILGLTLSFVGLAMTFYVQQPWAFVLASAIFGLGISPVWIVALSGVKEEDRASQMGALYTLWLIGLGAGPVVVNFFLDVSFIVSFWIHIALWIFALFFSFFIPNEKISSTHMPPIKKQMKMLWDRLKEMKPLLPGMILQTTAAGMLVPILPSFASKTLGLTYTQYSLLLIVGGGCAVLGMIPMGRLSDRKGKKWFLVLGFGVFSLALFSLTLSSTMYTSLIWAMIIGISYSAVLPVWNAILSYQVPDGHEGVGWGIFSSVEGIGVMIGPILGGWIANTYHENVTVCVSALLLGGIALFYFLFPYHRLTGKQEII